MADLRTILRCAAVPLTLLVLFILFIVIYQLLNLPSAEELVQLARDYHYKYGHEIVFLAAIAEGLLVVNWYLPGSFVIALGVTLSYGMPLNALTLVALVILGFFLTSLINYAMGRYAWYRFLLFLGLRSPLEKMKRKVDKHGLSIIFSTFFHPNIGALTALSCGILRLSFWKFTAYSALALVVWNLLWGAIVYLAGPVLLNLLNMWVIIVMIGLWILIAVIRSLRQPKSKKVIQTESYKNNKRKA